MQISLSPQRRDDGLAIHKMGDILTVNGATFDFTNLPDGATIPAGEIPCAWIVGPVERVSGSLHLTLILPHGPAPLPSVAFPEPIIDPPDGIVLLPTATGEA
ncbi:hypothetical protein HGO38_01570 [Rhizobium sp. CG5]|uniref:hypothetical protein n=1 Tax=Rhizobium sp. CG5 TaxID=2726076 RepID=UPI002033FD9F|nr:hypothetical protein [Rhizobium sp. CG5]MCM2472165.1 hypothetical protein [Rhizobium sp. CG5]